MKKLLTIFIALAMVASLCAGFAPTSAKAATTSTLALTPAGNFTGGVDGSGAFGVAGVGTVTSLPDSTHAVVNITTAAVGAFATGKDVQALEQTGATSTTSGSWATLGIQTITLDTPPTTITITPGMQIAVDGSGTNGVGTVIGINGNTLVVDITTAAVGVIGPNVYQVSTFTSLDPNWQTLGSQTVAFTTAQALSIGDKLVVSMVQTIPPAPATAFIMVSGVPVVGDVATVTWQDTTATTHSVAWTVVAGDLTGTPTNNIALDLANLINALDLTTGKVKVLTTPTSSVLQLTQDVGGVAGNGKTVTATTTAVATATLTIHTLGGLLSPAYVEQGKTLQLVAVDATGAVIPVTYTMTPASTVLTLDASTTTGTTGLVLGLNVGVQVINAVAASGATGTFVVVVIAPQVITSMAVKLVPMVPVSTTSQQFAAIATTAAYPILDYTTNAAWTDTIPSASIATTKGLLSYAGDKTGTVSAIATGVTTPVNVQIAAGVVTLTTPVVVVPPTPVTKVIVLSIGSDIVSVDGKATTVDAAPEIVEGRTFVPIRFIAETFGATVTWLPETKGITIVLGTTNIGLQIGNATTLINGKIIVLEAAPYIKNSRTMVPLRVITEAFGGNVAWDPINHLITITYTLPTV